MRLAKSALRLKAEHTKIIDVAFDLVFASVDGYTRAFRKEFGINPSEYAKNPVPVKLFVAYGVKFKELRKEFMTVTEPKNVFIQVIHKAHRKVIIKRGSNADNYFDYCSEVGCDVWGLLCSMKSIGGEPVCLWLPKHLIKDGTSEYVLGVEVPVDFDGHIPEGFDIIDLPKCKYMMFQGEPFAEEDFEEAIGQVWEAIKKYNPETVGYCWDDTNPRIQLEPRGERGYIELMAVKAL